MSIRLEIGKDPPKTNQRTIVWTDGYNLLTVGIWSQTFSTNKIKEKQ